MFGGGGMQGAKGSASAGGVMTKLQLAKAIKQVRRANLAVAEVNNVFMVGFKGCFSFLPEKLRRVAKKVTGVMALCVSQCDAPA
jgi:hypothetical protein